MSHNRLFVIFSESQSALLDLTDWIARRLCSEPVSRILFHQKWSIFIQTLVYMALSEGGSLHAHTMSPKATMTPEALTRAAGIPPPAIGLNWMFRYNQRGQLMHSFER
jgi:hypothetical protein